ncbi:AAA family ATPase [Sphingopyxis sp.]|jgi:chloramphenicol 3-O-phosphotransferase|uniref:AAA family ATPase n=1 Tax=Sphingopyxis sp. TaxID=1908224 RepID=UPI002DEB8F3D|nr:AAA family ATPase [Sphingopyxis sp.]
MRLVFIHGPAASGKLTVARELAALTGLPLFHNHLVVDALLAVFPFGSPAFVELREAMWIDVFRAAAEEGSSLIFTFHPEASVAPDFPERVVALVEAAGGRVDFVALTCAPEVVAARVEAASRQASGKLSSLALLSELEAKGAFAYPPIAAAVEVDTGAVEPAEAAIHIRDALELRRG